MRQLLLTFFGLLTVFFVSWGVKIRMPVNRPAPYEEEASIPWYEGNYTAPVADSEWILDESVPNNYIPVPGQSDLFMIIDNGKITKYRKRTKLADGKWKWEDVNPDIPEDYVPVEGVKDVYLVTYPDGSTAYMKYVRNEDDTFCFIPCDEKGVPLDIGSDAEHIGAEYVHDNGNIYKKYNDDGVFEGYRERVQNEDGSFTWALASKPEITIGTETAMKIPDTAGNAVNIGGIPQSASGTNETVSVPQSGDVDFGVDNEGGIEADNYTSPAGGQLDISDAGDGTYREVNKVTNTVTENGYKITYEKEYIYTYDQNGNLLYTDEGETKEIAREKVGKGGTPNPSLIAGTLDGEVTRLGASVSYDYDKAKQLLADLNAERTGRGLSSLSMNENSIAYKLALVRTADMALYNHSSSSSPMYGTLEEMCERWSISANVGIENVIKLNTRDADEINLRLMSGEGSRSIRMDSEVTSVGIAVVTVNGNDYVAEIFLA